MLKTTLIALGCSVVTATTTLVYAGRTVISSPFQLDIPFGSGLKVAQDPADVWSWHHEFLNVSPQGAPVSANVLVDFDGNGMMDTEHSWLRVMITDLELVSPQFAGGIATISDGTGKRYSVGVGGASIGGGVMPVPVQHVSLSSPIVLPIGSSLQVSVQNLISGGSNPAPFEVNLIGRVVNL
ncbi:MAG TPA: hypothetical protein VK348_10355 [Planctomycetota bacterium]|nr:hypothetical protein [Planctomycetota bacterium]